MVAVHETACYFDNGRGSRLFGVRTHAHPDTARSTVVVFCHPIGEVKYSNYNAIVVLARRLASIGISSLRFDCTGFGDSEGETRDATISSCVEDVKSAIAMIAGDSPDVGICLIGTEFGATIARIVARDYSGISGLVMIAPVVSGASFRDNLLRSQQMSYVARGLRSPKQRELLENLHKDGVLDVKGETFGLALFEELSSIDLMQDDHPFSGSILIVCAPGDHNSARLADQYRRREYRVTTWLTTSGELWAARPEPSTKLPTDLFDSVAKWISQTS